MKLVKVSNIKWDCDDEKELAELPKEVTVALSDAQYEENEADNGTTVGELISDFYGWCHNGFEYEDYEGEAILPDVDFTEM